MVRHLVCLLLVAALAVGCDGGSGGSGAGGTAGSGSTGGTTGGGGTGGSGSGGGGTQPASSPAVIAVTTPASPSSGVIDVPFQVTGGPAAILTVSYSVDGGHSYFPAAAAPGSPSLAGVTAGSYVFRWDSNPDMGPTSQDHVKVRIEPSAGQTGETAEFRVDDSAQSLGVRLIRYPYLQRGSRDAMTVVWRTDRAATGAVEYGQTPALGLVATHPGSAEEHVVDIAGLQPGTDYYYRVISDGVRLTPGHRFHTNNALAQTSFDFVVFGDGGSGSPIQHDLARRMEILDPDFGIVAGDVVYEYGAWWEFDPHYFGPYRNLLRDHVFYPALGNHDIITFLGQPYLEYFYCPTAPNGSERYYAFDYGNARFICLDSSTSVIIPGTGQYNFLVDQLLAPDRPDWTFVYMHHPPYSSGSHGSDRPLRWVVSPLFENEEVDVVFTGHDHDYERTNVIHDYAPQNRGVVYWVCGSAGKPSRSIGSSSFTAFSSGENVVLYCQINGRTLTAQAVRADGSVLDSATITKP